MSGTNKCTGITSQTGSSDTLNQTKPINPSQPAGLLFTNDWENGSTTTVSEYYQEKRVPMYANLCITNTTFAAEGNEDEIYKKISELNQKELHGVYIYDQENSKIIYRTVNHYKKGIFEGDESKYFNHLANTDHHSEAKLRFFS